MKFWPWGGGSKVEQKSGSGNVPNQVGFLNFLQRGHNYDLAFHKFIEYYKMCEPFAEAVDLRADAFADIKPVLVNKKTGDVVEDEEYMAFLERPNSDMNYKDFARHLSSMMDVTGNPFIKLLGPESRPPLEIDVVSPVFTTLFPDFSGRLERVFVSSEFENATYHSDRKDGYNRLRANQDNELWQIVSFNPDRGTRRLYSTPMAQSCSYDIEQVIEAGAHNKSLLQNGARVGGVLTTKDNEYPLSDEQFKRMQDQFDAFHRGSENAGRPLVAENMEWKDNHISNKDMDYEHLVANARSAIYKRYKIPLPMTEQGSQTFNNYASAQLTFYDQSVLPHADFLLSNIKDATLYRFRKDHKDLILTYDPTSITALETRKVENIKVKKEVGVHSVNELRQDFGDEPVDGGDSIFIESNKIPLNEEEFSNDATELNQPAEQE